MTFDPAQPAPAAPAPLQPTAPLESREPMRGTLGPGGVVALILGVLVTAAAAFGAFWVLTHQQRVVDQFTVWQYEPDPVIAGYADRAGLTDEGRFLFYASEPEVESEESFNAICSSEEEGFGILGCYLPGPKLIYLYDVTDDRLDGIEEVVATHEMLHAVWDRMTPQEREALAPALEEAAAALAGDEQFDATMEFYATTEPGQRLNELHSILGTEYADLGPVLDAHYATYITDRSTVLALHEQSNSAFREQAAAAQALVEQIDTLVAGIDADYAVYAADYEVLNAEIDAFNTRADAGDFASQAEFDAERNALLARQAALDEVYASIEQRVAQYDTLVVQLEELNAEIDGLNAAINITPPDVPELRD